tara:strand:- start:58926 stop:59039 length:114 start_codon:yes stop_codon:yes gene_type:complete
MQIVSAKEALDTIENNSNVFIHSAAMTPSILVNALTT